MTGCAAVSLTWLDDAEEDVGVVLLWYRWEDWSHETYKSLAICGERRDVVQVSGASTAVQFGQQFGQHVVVGSIDVRYCCCCWH